MLSKSLVAAALYAITLSAGVTFRQEEIASRFGIGYAIRIHDMNGDRKPDVVAINQTQAVWFENPTWKKHVILDGATKKDNVCFAISDIDGDGKPDLAVGADWQPTNTKAGGSLQWISSRAADAKGLFKLWPLGEEPTLHRMNWGDVDGDGKQELVVVPLHGRENAGPKWEGAGLRVLVYKVPGDPAVATGGSWPVEVADESLHIGHNFLVTNMDRDKAQEIVVASREGIHVLKRASAGWNRTKIGSGAPGEIKLGNLGKRQRALATIEPWHGNSVVVYREPKGGKGEWAREVIDESLKQGHALGWADFDGDGIDDLIAGWRDKTPGVVMYKFPKKPGAGKPERVMIDDGGMAVEDLAVGDLNGDGCPEIAAAGRATSNVRIYWCSRTR